MAQHELAPIEKHLSPDGSAVESFRPGSTILGYWLLAVADRNPYIRSENDHLEMASVGYTAD